MSAIPPGPATNAADDALELQIDAAFDAMVAASSDTEQREHFHSMCRLILRRSPHQVYKMELEKRIAQRQQ